jgi:hypothetical protein
MEQGPFLLKEIKKHMILPVKPVENKGSSYFIKGGKLIKHPLS